ncbi:MAG: DUF512 domain-containing protein [Clostridia bacterium]|nr:DUF512 domain-containing protein [Clostridia bacterium]
MSSRARRGPYKIAEVRPNSIAWRHGIRPGNAILSINGEPLIDNVDYQSLTTRSRVQLTLVKPDGAERNVTIVKARDAGLGIVMEADFASTPMPCKNKCIFCFIDQMPPGMRNTLYVKDDDWRFSLAMGNYITLTNLDEEEFSRILRRKASPLYISVHATDPEIRKSMMKNPEAVHILDRLKRLAEAGIIFHCQIVLCPDVNDGAVLDQTLETLFGLWPAARSAALVPVGLTKFRDHLPKLRNYDQAGALSVLNQAQRWQARFYEACGTRFVFPSDEFFCKAGLHVPEDDYYENYPQIENGVGLLRKFEQVLAERSERGKRMGESGVKRRVMLACGTSIAPVMRRWIDRYGPEGPQITVTPVINRFFGDTVTVTGLLTGRDIGDAVRGADVDELLLCANTLRSEGDRFLDDLTMDEFRALVAPIRVTVVQNRGDCLYEALLGKDDPALKEE